MGVGIASLLLVSNLGANDVRLTITQPYRTNPDVVPYRSVQPRSGWELELRLKARERRFEGIFQIGASPGDFPNSGGATYLVFDSGEDECPYVDGNPDCPEDLDERFVRFTADSDSPGVADGLGDAVQRTALDNNLGQPEWGGPALFTGDGIGYGANDDLPSLVVMSDVGVGIVYDPLELSNCLPSPPGSEPTCVADPLMLFLEGWERAVPAARHNLAGLFQQTSFELTTKRNRTEVRTALDVPTFLFSHLVAGDPCPGAGFTEETCFIGFGQVNKIDAGPWNDPGVLVDSARVEVRAALVQGTAPSAVVDCTGEGDVTADDLVCMGSELVSNEAVVEFDQINNYVDFCNQPTDSWMESAGGLAGEGLVYSSDVRLGGNVLLVRRDPDFPTAFQINCPGGSSTVLRPPR